MSQALILSVFSVFAAMVPGFYLSKKNVLTDSFLRVLTQFIIRIAYPFLTFTSVIINFNFDKIVKNYHLPLMLMFILLLSYLGIRIIVAVYKMKHGEDKRTLLYLGTFSNYIFLPYAVVSYAMDERMGAAVVIASLGAEIITWTLGVFILKNDVKLLSKETLKHLFSAPLRGLYFGIFALFLMDVFKVEDKEALLSNKYIEIFWSALLSIAKTTVPLTLTLAGANIAKVDFKLLLEKRIWGIMAYRLIIAPAFVIGILYVLMPNYEYVNIFYIIAIMPFAFNSLVLGEMFGANMRLIGGALLISYLLSLITMPIWLLLLF